MNRLKIGWKAARADRQTDDQTNGLMVRELIFILKFRFKKFSENYFLRHRYMYRAPGIEKYIQVTFKNTTSVIHMYIYIVVLLLFFS